MAKDKSIPASSLGAIFKKYGDVISSGTGLIEQKSIILHVSPAIDIALGGGIPEGSMVSFSGPPGCGKSSTVLQIIANAQKEEFNVNGATRKIFYADVEHRLKPMNMTGIIGLKPELINVIKSNKEKILSAQDFLDIIESIVKDPENEGCIVVLDSSSALCPADELVHETSGQIRTTQPKIMSHWCKKMASSVKVMNATVIFIQHLITNTSGYGEKYQVDGGEKLKYHLDVKLMTKGKPEKWESKDGIQVGQVVEWDVLKSAMGASNTTAKSCLRFGKGLDIIKETFGLCVDFGVINKSGAWFSFQHGEEEIKSQGEENMCLLLAEKPELFKYLTDILYSMIKK